MILQTIICVVGILFSAINFSEGVKYDRASNTSYLPVVLWHGMGDSCCFSFSLGRIMDLLRDEMPNVYIKSIRIGNNEVEDMKNSYFGDINAQIDRVCYELSHDPQLKSGYNAIGFSQGGQFLRAIAQRCPHPRMYNLISLGGQHQGVYGIPNCMSLSTRMCDYIRETLTYAAYTDFLQEHMIQAGYWHDPLNAEEYRTKNRFLADINNEKNINADYVRNLKKLKKFVLVKFLNDTMVYPPESEWFGFYKDGTTTKVQPLKDTNLYKQDRLGLRKMIANNQIDFLELPENHLRFDEDWFIDKIVNAYLKVPAVRRIRKNRQV